MVENVSYEGQLLKNWRLQDFQTFPLVLNQLLLNQPVIGCSGAAGNVCIVPVRERTAPKHQIMRSLQRFYPSFTPYLLIFSSSAWYTYMDLRVSVPTCAFLALWKGRELVFCQILSSQISTARQQDPEVILDENLGREKGLASFPMPPGPGH